jgi:uncharacterized protein (TIGR03000 family)
MFGKRSPNGPNQPEGWPGVAFVKEAALVAGVLLLAGAQALSGPPTKGGDWYYPWRYHGYRGYQEPRPVQKPSGPLIRPQKYWLYVNTLPDKKTKQSKVAEVLFHVPENAEVWIQGVKLPSKGTHHRRFVSPPLSPKVINVYTVSVNWIENNKWASQTHSFEVVGGTIHCVYLMKSSATLAPKTRVAKNLAKLSPKDRKLARAQRYCAVQDGIKLGAMGVPVKVMVKGKPVFLCCPGCKKRAESNPEGALAKAKELKTKFKKKTKVKKLRARGAKKGTK